MQLTGTSGTAVCWWALSTRSRELKVIENKSNLSRVYSVPEIILRAGGTAVVKTGGNPCCHGAQSPVALKRLHPAPGLGHSELETWISAAFLGFSVYCVLELLPPCNFFLPLPPLGKGQNNRHPYFCSHLKIPDE